jgi:nicotinamidase-related amidase
MPPRTPLNMSLAAVPLARIEPDRTALVVIDAQRAFTDPERGIGAEMAARGVRRELDEYYRQAAAALPNIARLAHEVRRRGGLVVHSLLAAGRLGRQLRLARLPVPDDPAAEIVPEATAQPGDVVLTRGSWGPFADGALAGALAARRVERIFLCGMPGNLSVALAAREAADRDLDVLVAQDACAFETYEWHSLAILALSGGTIRTGWTEEAVEMLEGRRT